MTRVPPNAMLDAEFRSWVSDRKQHRAPALDANNNLYIAVGNGVFSGGSNGNMPKDLGHSVVKLTSAAVTPVDFYTPNDFSMLNSNAGQNATCLLNSSSGSCPPPLSQNSITIPKSGDVDLGSGGVTLVSPAVPTGSGNPLCPSNLQLVAGGKEGVIYDACYSTSTTSSPQSTMGGLDSCGYSCNTVAPSYSAATACTQSTTLPTAGNIAQCFPGINVLSTYLKGGSGSRATAAFWAGNTGNNGANVENYLYVAGSGDSLRAYKMLPTSWQFQYQPGAVATSPAAFGYPGASPAISWWSTQNTGTAVLWAVNVSKAGSGTTTTTSAASPAQLFAYNPIPNVNNAITELWSDTTTGPGGVKYAVPTIADGMVFVAGGVQGYYPGLIATTNVNCSPAAYYTGSGSSCPGLLVVYGQTK